MTSNPHRILIGVLSLNFGWLTGSAQTAALGSASAANTPATVATAPATTELTAALPQAVSAADQVAAGSAFVIAQAGEAFAIVSAAEQGDRSQAGRLASLVATIRADVRVPEYEEIRIYIDDRLYFTSRKDGGDWTSWPFSRDFYLVLNVAIGGDWGGEQGIDEKAFPQRMEVDYFRVYQRGATSISGR